MLDHQVSVEGVGVVVVERGALLVGEVVVGLVVVVVAQHRQRVAELGLEALDQRGLAAAGASGDADDQNILHGVSPFSSP